VHSSEAMLGRDFQIDRQFAIKFDGVKHGLVLLLRKGAKHVPGIDIIPLQESGRFPVT
jgi:hypothetical protein